MEEKNFRSDFAVAAHKGDLEKVKSLYQTVPLHRTREQCYFALYFAAFSGHEDIVTFLLSQRVDPNFLVDNYLTPLHAAAFKGSERIVEMLLRENANVNPKIPVKCGEQIVMSDHFCSPLQAAVNNKHTSIVNLLLQRGANVNVKMLSKVQTFKYDYKENLEKDLNYGNFFPFHFKSDSGIVGYSPLHLAIMSGNADIVKSLLEHGADVHAKCGLNKTPFFVACTLCSARPEYIPIIHLILKAGANVQVEVKDNNTLLHHILQCFVEKSWENSYEGYCKKEEIMRNKVFRLMLKLGANPNSWSPAEGNSILHFAVKNVMPNVVHLLLKHGADVNVLDKKKKTPLEYAISFLKSAVEEFQECYYYIPESDSEDEEMKSDYSNSSEERYYKQKREEKEEEREEMKQYHLSTKRIYDLTHNEYKYNVAQYRRDKRRYNDGFTVEDDPDINRTISQLLTRELARLEEMGKSNIQNNVTLLQTDFVKPYYTKCKNELKKMKKVVIIEGVYYYDFLFASEEKLKEYMGNSEIRAALNSNDVIDHKEMFPNYCRFLKFNVKRGLQLKRENEEEESNGSSDEEEGVASVQIFKPPPLLWVS